MGPRFVRLGIAGFKSFADPVALDIHPGLTGIVGPNGCGKSNVAEALRWAMGEANARTLRGGEMDDIIFAGTVNRPGRNLAEVSLSIEAEDGALPPPFTAMAELQVTRRLERGGGSTYRVNGREARARDVQTLFADLASGARSSAMVSQGRVGALVGARPEERRSVLEEAAGITGLHARRSEAETRLRAAEANLERAGERRLLLAQRIEGLRAQAKQAARYRAVAEALLETESLLLATIDGRARAGLERARAAIEQARATVGRAMQAAHGAQARATAAQAALGPLRESAVAAAAGLERARLAEEAIAAETARAREALQAASQREAQARRDLVHARSGLEEAEAADRRLAEERVRLEAEASSHPAALAAARAEAEAAAAALAAIDQTASGLAARAAEARARAGALRQALQQAEARARRATELVTRLESELAQARARLVEPAALATAQAARTAAGQALEQARAAQDRSESAHAAQTAAAAAARDRFARLDAARQRLAAERAALAEVLAVRDGERWPPMLDRLEVPPGLEAALGAVLGEDLAASDDPAAARHWRALPPPPPPVPAAGQRLADLIAAPPALGRALGAVLLIEDAGQAEAAQAGLRPGECLVSAAGALWRWDGYTVRAGTPTAAAVRLQQRNRLAALSGQLAEAEREAARARAERDATAAAERAAAAAQQQARAARREAEGAAERAREAARTLEARAETAAARLAAIEQQRQSHEPERAAAAQALEEARREQTAAPDPEGLGREAEAARAQINAARARDGAAARALEGLGRAEIARRARLLHIGREREDRRLRAEDLRGRVTDLAARLAEAETEQRRLAAVPAGVEARTAQARQALSELEAAHAGAAGRLAAAEAEAVQAEAARRAAEHAVFAARESLVRSESGLEAAAAAAAESHARRAEREGALPLAPPEIALTQEAEDRARARLSRLTRERDAIGAVNLRAEIETAEVEAEIETIAREEAELGQAIAKLRGAIGHLNREGRERLASMFQQIDRNFQALFGRVFGGGRAHLAMVGSDDPLLAGLEIYAQPPGKKLSALTLLSGGEQALTALALVFAVFRCNPAPLCVLDEVDAPLDDANVERFCDLLAEMVAETGTRFLVVTHHQLTMARMDRLFGVTMQERGVSRLLSVDLTQAARIIEAVAAE